MREEDFWRSTLRSLINRIEGYNSHYQIQQQEAWERSRMLAFFSVIPHAKKGKLNNPQDIIKFPWEINTSPNALSKLSRAELRERAMKLFERDQKRAELNGQNS